MGRLQFNLPHSPLSTHSLPGLTNLLCALGELCGKLIGKV